MTMTIKYELKEYKSILNKYKFIDGWFWCRYSINCYGGCEHACTYCDSRSHKYHFHPEFDHVIYVKKDIGETLAKRLSRARTLLPDVVALSGATDPYQPAENKYKNTRQVLEVLAKHEYPVFIATKSTLVTRDIDILSEIAESSAATVSITITCTDRELTSFLEPAAPSPKQRFAAISQLKKKAKALQVGVLLIPIVPFLTDSDDQLEDMVKRTQEAGADFLLFGGGMTMRDNQADWFLRQLKERYPDLIEKYLQIYEAEWTQDRGYKGRYAPKSQYVKEIDQKMYTLINKSRISCRLKRFIPLDFRRENYIIAEEFINESYFRQAFNLPWKNIFWAGQNINNLKESIKDVARRGELQKIRNIDGELEKRIIARLNEL